MIAIELENIRRVSLKFEEFPEEMRTELETEIRAITNELLGEVVAAAPYRTGELRRQIRGTVNSGKDYIVGRVGFPAGLPKGSYGKAGALEYGSHRAVSVHRRGKTYRRIVNIAAFRFLRGPFEAMRGVILIRLQAALARAAAK